ncbi:MAG: hypothetical protein RBS78_08630 [Coriobacteriia bacterium]|jgi:hypothetical protein|nr:hypothetical protein [Coriobacteriia bacterium]
MGPARGFAIAVSVALISVFAGLLGFTIGIVLDFHSVTRVGLTFLGVGAAAAVLLLIMLGMRKEARG